MMNQSVEMSRLSDQVVDNKAVNSHWEEWKAKYGEGAAALLSGAMALGAWFVTDLWPIFSIILYSAAFIVGGYVKAKEGLETLVKEKDLDVNLLMIVAALGAASIGYWAEGAMLIFIFALSGALETYTMNKSSRDISALMDLKPENARVIREGQELLVSIDALQIDDVLLVKPGERVPADGMVTEGSSSINQASITGESIPVDKMVGDEVFAGTLNGEGVIFIQVTKTSESSLFSKIIRMVQEAQQEMPKSQVFVEKFERMYARIIILATLLLIVVPPLVFQDTWSAALYRAMVFIVVASPCALAASIMPAMLSAISNSARKGLLFKGGAHIENLSRVKAIAFDKTGTLTNGHPVVAEVVSYQGLTSQEVLEIAASLESYSNHPIAKAIVDHAGSDALQGHSISDFQSITGFGLQANRNGIAWKVGKPAFMESDYLFENVMMDIERMENEGKTLVVLQNPSGIAGIIALQDQIRPDTSRVIRDLKAIGIHTVMLTGDQQKTAEAIGRQAGIQQVYADLLPEDKLSIIKQLKQSHHYVAMVGDGVNDAPALATASVGIAMGAGGSDVALETADLVLMNDDLSKLRDAIILGRRSRRIVKQNLVFSITVIVALIATNFISGIPLPLGVVGHEGSTILVILNGLRLLR